MKVFRRSTSPESIDAEIDALARASSPHLAGLLDLTTDARGVPALVLARVGSHSLARLLADRRELSAGEAVTVLAPLVEAVDELHRVGVVHSRLTAGNVLFDDRGASVLVGFGHARVVGAMPLEQTERSLTSAEADACAPMRTELAELRALVRLVVEATPPSPAREVLWRSIPFEGEPAPSTAELLDRLFSFAEPEPIARFTDPVPIGRPSRSAIAESLDEPPLGRLAGWLERLPVGLPDWIIDLVDRHSSYGRGLVEVDGAGERLVSPGRARAPVGIDRATTGPELEREPGPERDGPRPRRIDSSGPASLLASIRGAARRFLAPVRRSVWIAAGSAVVLVGSGLVGVAALEAGLSADPRGSPSAAGSTSEQRSGPTDPSEQADGDEPGGTGGAEGGGVSAGTAITSVDLAALTADDPLAATSVLLRLRSACLDATSTTCLRDVDQLDSAAMDADLSTLRDQAEGRVDDPVPSPGPDPPTLVGRWGDSALVDVVSSAPAGQGKQTVDGGAGESSVTVSVLLVTGDDGWRIRDLTVG